MALYDPTRPEPGRPDNPRRPGDSGQPAGLDPTRDPQKPGAPDAPNDSRTRPPSAIREDDGPGVTPTAPSPERPSSPDDKGGRADPM